MKDANAGPNDVERYLRRAWLLPDGPTWKGNRRRNTLACPSLRIGILARPERDSFSFSLSFVPSFYKG